MTEQFNSDCEWCLVANVITQPFGEKYQIQKGTKHFSPNTKVYCSAPHWGDGYEKIVVAGRHRGSSKLVLMVVPTKRLTNWRAQCVYLPKNIRGGWRIKSWHSKEEIEALAKSLCLHQEATDAKKQGFDKINPNDALIYTLVLREVAEVHRAIERGADVNYRLRHDGITPLTVALRYYHYMTTDLRGHNLIQILLENSADVKTISYQLIESVTHNPLQYSDYVLRLVEQAIDELFPHSIIMPSTTQ